MAKATRSELYLRKLNKFLTVEEYNDPVKSARIRSAFWAGASAARSLAESMKKARKRKP